MSWNSHSSEYDARSLATLYMGGLEPYMDDNFIVCAFKEIMERPDNIVKNIKFGRDKITGLPHGHAFVTFLDQNTAHKVLHRCSGKIIPKSDPAIRFKLNIPGGGNRPNEYNVWVGDLAPTVTDELLHKHFCKAYRSILSAHVIMDKMTGESKGFGFVHFSDETEQQKCMIEFNNTELEGKMIKCRSARQQQRYQSYGQNYAPQTYSDMSYYNTMGQGQWYKPTGQSVQSTNTATSQYTEEIDDPDAPVEAVLRDDSTQINKDFVTMSGEVYSVLEDSRWMGMIHPTVKSSENNLMSHFTAT